MRLSMIILAISTAAMLSSCASTSPVSGALYADEQGPIAATSNTRGAARGEACAVGYLGLVAMGDASINTAAKNGGISTISNVDHTTTNILGLYAKYCTVVWGQKTARN